MSKTYREQIIEALRKLDTPDGVTFEQIAQEIKTRRGLKDLPKAIPFFDHLDSLVQQGQVIMGWKAGYWKDRRYRLVSRQLVAGMIAPHQKAQRKNPKKP